MKKDVPGFIGNRLQHALWREAISLVERGICDAETVDTVIKAAFGRRLAVLGPLENADLVGTDLTLAIHKTVLPDIDSRPGPSPYLERLVAEGKLGFKSGEGFRKWSAGAAGGAAGQGAAASEEGARQRDIGVGIGAVLRRFALCRGEQHIFRVRANPGHSPMTQIRSMAQPVPRRPGELGVHSLDHFNLLVPDVAEAEKFYGLFGLDTKEEDGKLALYTHGHPHRWGIVAEGPAQEVELRLVRRVRGRHAALPRAAGEACGSTGSTRPRASSRTACGSAIPTARWSKSASRRKARPTHKATFEMKGGEVGRQNAPNRSKAHKVRPRRLAHVLLFSPDISRTIAFLPRRARPAPVRPLRRSGRLHARHPRQRPSHDRLREVRRARPAPLSWDVGSINDIGVGATHMADKGFAYGWGLGRHVLGSNYFHYVRDPWGSYAEYSCDIDYIPVDQDWQAADQPAEDSFYMWGPNPPAGLRAQFRGGEVAPRKASFRVRRFAPSRNNYRKTRPDTKGLQ